MGNCTLIDAHVRQVRAGQAQLQPCEFHLVGIHQGSPVQASCVCDGTAHHRLQTQGDIDIVPAGLGGSWTDEGPCSVLLLRVNHCLIARAAESLGLGTLERTPLFQLRDPQLEHLAWTLQKEQEAGWVTGQLYQDSLGVALSLRLVQSYTRSLPTIDPYSGIGERRMRQLREYIEDNLEQPLGLGELAALVGLSESHFKVVFKRWAGLSVHQYVLRRRVERARSLLLQSRLAISQVALQVGFAHQSHLAHWMKRLLNTTPARLKSSAP